MDGRDGCEAGRWVDDFDDKGLLAWVVACLKRNGGNGVALGYHLYILITNPHPQCKPPEKEIARTMMCSYHFSPPSRVQGFLPECRSYLWWCGARARRFGTWEMKLGAGEGARYLSW